MRESRSLGSVRGVPGNRHSYRDILDFLLAIQGSGSPWLCNLRLLKVYLSSAG